jgi:putative transposase
MTQSPQGATVEALCRLADIPRASYYRHFEAKAPAYADAELRHLIHTVALAHPFYGYRRVAKQLKRAGVVVNKKRVQRLMQEDNLLALRIKPFVPRTTESRHGFTIVPNRIRGLIPSGPDQIWVADITYVRLNDTFVYLAVVLDAWSRRVVGWAMAAHLGASLALDALRMALAARKPVPGSLIHHSDRGVQYACGEYRDMLNARAIAASMSQVGNPYDNAKAESFMKTLKYEEVNAKSYQNLDEARRNIGRFIEDVYNANRLHSALGYQTPLEFEAHSALIKAA